MMREELQKLQEMLNRNYPGMMMFARDINLSEAMIAKYKPGMIIREKAFVDATARVGGMVTNAQWLDRCAFPVGMDDQGNFWPV